jgi:hypothetical protein
VPLWNKHFFLVSRCTTFSSSVPGVHIMTDMWQGFHFRCECQWLDLRNIRRKNRALISVSKVELLSKKVLDVKFQGIRTWLIPYNRWAYYWLGHFQVLCGIINQLLKKNSRSILWVVAMPFRNFSLNAFFLHWISRFYKYQLKKPFQICITFSKSQFLKWAKMYFLDFQQVEYPVIYNLCLIP